MPDEEVLSAATAVRTGVTKLARRLRLERTGPRGPLLQLAVLAHLRRGPMTPGQVAVLEKVQPQTLTRTLSSLESEQLITREADPDDGRRSLLAITNQGLLALRNDMGERDAWLARTMAEHLTATERELLRLAGDLLERLAEVAVGGVPPGAGGSAAADQRS